MYKICLCNLNSSPWNNRIREAMFIALKEHENYNVTKIDGLPKDNYYDVLILCGIKLLFKRNLNIDSLRNRAKIIVELGDEGMDPRKTDSDLYFYFNPSEKVLYENYKYLPKFVDKKYLYPEQNDKLTIYIDHYRHQTEKEKFHSIKSLQFIFEQLSNFKHPKDIFYHSINGVELNPTNIVIPKDEKQNYKYLAYEEICRYYRRSHLFFATHRETQGMVAQEIGACGGLTLMQDWMYPKKTHYQFKHYIYDYEKGIDFEKIIKLFKSSNFIKENREHVLENCSFESFKKKLIYEIENILNKNRN